jgi:hypothetical protein
VKLWNEPGPEDFDEGDHLRQRLTVAVLGAFVVVVLSLVLFAAWRARHLETVPCGSAFEARDGGVVVVRCEADDAPRGSGG